MAGERSVRRFAAQTPSAVITLSLQEEVAACAHRHRLWNPGDKILIGLSGGPDSVCLLSILHNLQLTEKISLGAVHVNYGLRGAESDGDAEFCMQLCDRLDIPLQVIRVTKHPTGNTQAWARDIRHDVFRSHSNEHGYDRIALGHTLNDRAEGLLLQLMRGAGLERIGYLPPATGNLIRPLIESWRATIQSYLAGQRIVFRVDRSNFGRSYVRNRVRHEVLPMLSRVFDVDAESVLNDQAELLALDAAFIETSADELWGRVVREENEIHLATESLESYHPAIRLRVLRRMAAALDIPCGRETSLRLLELVEADPGRRVELTADAAAERGREDIWMFRRTTQPEPVEMPIPGVVTFSDGSTLRASVAAAAPPFPDGRWRARLALPEGVKQWQVRGVQDGDRIVPFGMTGSRLVMDMLAEAGVARHLRQRRLVLTGDGEIYWILGLRISESARVTDQSKNVYEFVRDAESI